MEGEREGRMEAGARASRGWGGVEKDERRYRSVTRSLQAAGYCRLRPFQDFVEGKSERKSRFCKAGGAKEPWRGVLKFSSMLAMRSWRVRRRERRPSRRERTSESPAHSCTRRQSFPKSDIVRRHPNATLQSRNRGAFKNTRHCLPRRAGVWGVLQAHSDR